MSYDEIDIEDMGWKEDIQAFTYQCPCGDLFQITMVGFATFCAEWNGMAGKVVCRPDILLLLAGRISSRRGNSSLSQLFAIYHSHLQSGWVFASVESLLQCWCSDSSDWALICWYTADRHFGTG